MRDAMLAEFTSPESLIAAIEGMRARGYRHLDAFTPYSIHEVDHALRLRRSRLPFLICGLGLLSAGTAYALQWFLNAYLYPLNVGGRPPHFPLAFVIITFEMGILIAALTAFFGVLARGRMLKLYDPIYDIDDFGRATDDRFWLIISADDPR